MIRRQPFLPLSLVSAFLVAAVLSSSCTTIGQVANLGDAPCAEAFEGRLATILAEEGEAPEAAKALAHRSLVALARPGRGPRPFLVAAPSGTDYTFFVQKKPEACLLRLYGRRKGFMSYTNNLTYIATQALPGCTCEE